MNSTVAIQQCFEYDLRQVEKHIEWIWREANGPDPSGKRILVKPNILSDEDPVKAMTTHPVVVESIIRYLQARGGTVFVGDSPTIDTRGFTGEKSGIRQATERCGAKWVRFNDSYVLRKVGNAEIKITARVEMADLVISVSKLKNHELMVFSGAMKNIFGFVPGFNKAVQHVTHPDKYKLGRFFVDLEEAVRPHFHIMDGIIGMDGPGPGNGYPKRVNVLLASANPLALDIVASRIVGYDPLEVTVSRIALERGALLKSMDEIVIKGPNPEDIVVKDFKRIYRGGESGILLKGLKKKMPFLKRLDRRPLFDSQKCAGCSKCVEICPVSALVLNDRKSKKILIDDAKCIRCYCCSEVCREGAVEIRRKIF